MIKVRVKGSVFDTILTTYLFLYFVNFLNCRLQYKKKGLVKMAGKSV